MNSPYDPALRRLTERLRALEVTVARQRYGIGTPPGGTAPGDIGGTPGVPTVTGIGGIAIDSLPPTTTGDVIVFNAVSGHWEIRQLAFNDILYGLAIAGPPTGPGEVLITDSPTTGHYQALVPTTATYALVSAATSTPPTESEIEALIGLPAAFIGAAYLLTNTATGYRYHLLCDGLAWMIVPTVLASGVIVPSILTITTADDGGWTMIPDEKAFYYNGKTYFGPFINGAAGNSRIGSYTNAGGATVLTTLAAAYQKDTHASGSLLLRTSDRKIVGVQSKHDGTTPYVWISTNAEDVSAFGAAITPSGSIGGSDFTYMRLVELSDGLYLWYRDEIGAGATATGRLCYTKSVDGGATWSARTIVYTGATGRTPYWRIGSNFNDRVDIFITDREWYDQANPASLYHMYFLNSTGFFYTSADVQITATMPFGPSALTLVKSGASQGMVWCSGATGGNTTADVGAIAYVGIGSSDNSVQVARWDGAAWVCVEVARTNGVGTGDRYNPGAHIHPSNPDLVYMGRYVSGHSEMHRYVSADSGATWTGTQLTSGSTVDNYQPAIVRDGIASLEAIWLYGTHTGATNFHSGIRGASL